MHSLHRLLKFHPELLLEEYYRDTRVPGSVTLEEHQGLHRFSGDGFLNLATRFGIIEYLERRAQPGALSELTCHLSGIGFQGIISDHLVFAYAISLIRATSLIHRRKEKFVFEGSQFPLLLDPCLCFPPRVETFRFLLERGANFNQVTVW